MRKAFWNNPWFFIPALVFLNAGLALQLFVPYGAEILYLNPLRAEPLNTFFRWWTHAGEALSFFALGLLAMLWRFRFALLIAMAGLIVLPTSFFLKDQIGIDRPVTYFGSLGLQDAVVFVPGVVLNDGQTSFPSGHSMAAFALFGLCAFMIGRRWPLLAFTCAWTAMLVGLSRIFLVQHFLVDVLGGTAIGLFVAVLVWGV
ncbi:MAG: phosphatase PAP2 family protein, partial [Saprospiraceae bacterium]